jgi:hypothetical protein
VSSRARLLVVHATLSIVLGVARTGIQSAIDPGQYWAGVVSYPAESGFTEYLRHMVDLQTFLSALLLKVGFNELFISGLFTIFGIFFYLGAFCNITLYLTSSYILSIAVPIFLLHTGFGIYGINYEIVVPPGQLTFAPFAIAYSAFFITNSLHEEGFWNQILASLVTLLHPFWGIYASGAQAIAILLTQQADRFRRAGIILLVSLVSVLVLTFIRGSYGEAEQFSRLILTNPSKHRVPLELNHELIFLGVNMVMFLIIAIRRTGADRFFATQVFSLAVTGLLLSAVYLIRVDEMPVMLRIIYQSIPNRSCNLMQLLGPPIVLCYGYRISNNSAPLVTSLVVSYWVVVLMSLARFSSTRLLEGLPLQFGRPFPNWELIIYGLGAITSLYLIFTSKKPSTAHEPSWSWTACLFAPMIILVCVQNFLYASQFEQRNSFYKNDSALATVRMIGSDGVLVAGIDNLGKHFPQARTRSPIVYDVQLTAVLPYLQRSPEKTLQLAREAYGLDLLDRERSHRRNQPCDALDCDSVRVLFSTRTRHEWKALSDKYGFSVVLVPSTWTMDLPLEAKSGIWGAYRIAAQ